jgi:hypothetical protein
MYDSFFYFVRSRPVVVLVNKFIDFNTSLVGHKVRSSRVDAGSLVRNRRNMGKRIRT